MVHFVGAGPGATDLITIRGLKLLQQADVVIYAGSLVNEGLLQDIKEGCEVFNSAYMTLEEVLAVMERAEKEGKDTVRLHTGDPGIYGAIREQMDALEEKHIHYDYCPGVSSLFGAASALNLEYTLPNVSQSLIVTRAKGKTDVPEKESLKSFASHHATMVLFLSSGLSEQVKEELLAGGYAEDTPVAVVYKATWPDEKIIYTTIRDLPKDMEENGITKTALIVVGDVLRAKKDNQYEKSKLYDATFSTEYRERNT